MKRNHLGIVMLVTWLCSPWCQASVSRSGCSVVSIDARSGEVRWQFGKDLTDPQLQLKKATLMVAAIGEDGQLHTWELSKATGFSLREHEPQYISHCCLDYMSRQLCDDPSRDKLGSLTKSLPLMARSCDVFFSRCRIGEPAVCAFNPQTASVLWVLDLGGSVEANELGHVSIWPLKSSRGFIVLNRCDIYGLAESGRIRWKTRLLKDCREPGIVERPWVASLGRDVLIMHMNRLFRVNPRTGRVAWTFDAGPSSDPQPVFDGKYLYVARRER